MTRDPPTALDSTSNTSRSLTWGERLALRIAGPNVNQSRQEVEQQRRAVVVEHEVPPANERIFLALGAYPQGAVRRGSEQRLRRARPDAERAGRSHLHAGRRARALRALASTLRAPPYRSGRGGTARSAAPRARRRAGSDRRRGDAAARRCPPSGRSGGGEHERAGCRPSWTIHKALRRIRNGSYERASLTPET